MDEQAPSSKPENQSPNEAQKPSAAPDASEDSNAAVADTVPASGSQETRINKQPNPQKANYRIRQASVIFSAVILGVFLVITVYSVIRSTQLINEILPCNVSLSGTCSELKLHLLNSPEFTLSAKDQKLSQIIVSGGKGTWQGPLSLVMDDTKSLEVKTIETQPSVPTATLQVAAKASTRFDLKLPGETTVKFVSTTGNTVRHLQISPFASADWTAKFPRSENLKEPGMVIFPSGTNLVCETDSVNNLHIPVQEKVQLYPGKAWPEGDPISVQFQPQEIDSATPQIEMYWDARNVTFSNNNRLQMSPASITLKDIRLSEFSLDSESQTGMLGNGKQHLVLQPADLNIPDLSLSITGLSEEGMHIEVSGKASSCKLAIGSGEDQLCPSSFDRVKKDPTSQKHYGDYLITVLWADSFWTKLIFAIVTFCAGVLLTWIGLKPEAE